MSAPPLLELYDLLRGAGFAIGVDDHLRIGRLLECEATWTPELLRTAIAALVVADPAERDAFDACWNRWMASGEPARAVVTLPTRLRAEPPHLVLADPFALREGGARPAQRLHIFGRALVATVVVTAIAVLTVRSCTVTGSGEQPLTTASGSAGSGSGDPGTEPPETAKGSSSAGSAQDKAGSATPSGSKSGSVGSSSEIIKLLLSQPDEVDAAALDAETPSFIGSVDLLHLAVALGAMVLAIISCAAVLDARARRRFVPGPWRYVIAVPSAVKPILSSNAIEDAAADLTWRARRSGCELDIERSVAATVERAGLPTLVHHEAAAVLRYLVLEDIAGGAGRWQPIYDELLRGLAREGVEFERYTFAGDPEHCVRSDGRAVSLQELLDHADALIMIGDGDAAVDPFDGSRARWLASLHHVPRRLWINPVPPVRWSAGARVIAEDTPMEHGVARAVAALHAGIERRAAPARPFPVVIERAPGTATAVVALRAALGAPAFQLLTAVAMIGSTTIAAARYLAEVLSLQLDEQDWLAIAALPWFSADEWPSGLRDELRRALAVDSPSIARKLEVISDNLLVASEPPRNSGAHLAWQLEGARRMAHRGDSAAAVRSLNRLAATPLSHEARGARMALGFPHRTRRARVWAILVALVLIVGTIIVRVVRPAADCEHAAQGNMHFALRVCRNEYVAKNDPWTGARLANVLRRRGNRVAARALATDLLASPARSDAFQVLGKIDVAEHRAEEGQAKLEKARALHVAARRHREIAIDDQALAGIHRGEKRFAEALRSLDTCITESREAKDDVVEGYCHLSAGMVLVEIGYHAGALEELDLAEPLLVRDHDRADLEIERGILDLRNGLGPRRLMHLMSAVADFNNAIKHASAASLVITQRMAELNLVYALAELSAIDPSRSAEATAHLEIARQLDVDGSDGDERKMLQARIAYRRKNYALASSLNTEVFDRLHDDDDDYRLRVAVMQVEIGLATGSFDDAITWARRGVAITEAMRGEGSAIELRPWILSVRRQPYELLFTALARAHRLEEAVLAFDHWQGRTLLDQLARGEAPSPPTLRLAAMHADVLSRFVPALSRAPVVKLGTRSELLAALRDADAIALFVADDEVWRISTYHGQVDVVSLGPLTALQPALNAFRAHPDRVELGDALGEKLLGREPFRKTDETLFVVLDGGTGGELAGLPVAALRLHGEPLIALRPIVHPARLSALRCVPPLVPKHSFAIADARGNLVEARREALDLGKTYGFTTEIGPAATSGALFAAGPDDQLHVAVHDSVQPSGGSLDLYDRAVSALEISSRHGGPALVFLAMCSSAAASDSELADSFATAFLASDSSQVIATLRPVSDSGAAEIAKAFYARNGVDDPVRKLAAVQAQLAQTGNEDWPYFIVYGHDTCRQAPP